MRINPYPKPFIVIDGIDGCGKTTLLKMIQSWDKDAIFTSEPTNGRFGQEIREILKSNGYDKDGQKVKPEELQLLFIRDRAEHRRSEAAYLENYPLISDRDFPSTVSYGMAEGMNPKWILNKHEAMLRDCFFAPDLILILDLSAKETMKRIRKVGKQEDYFEKLAFQKKVRKAYLKFSEIVEESYPDIPMNIWIIDASRPADVVLKSALVYIEDVFEKKKK